MKRVIVKPDGKISVAIATSSLKHDVTGGVLEKLQAASNIICISEGTTRVFVTNIMSESASYSVCVLGVLEGTGTEIMGETQDMIDLEHH